MYNSGAKILKREACLREREVTNCGELFDDLVTPCAVVGVLQSTVTSRPALQPTRLPTCSGSSCTTQDGMRKWLQWVLLVALDKQGNVCTYYTGRKHSSEFIFVV